MSALPAVILYVLIGVSATWAGLLLAAAVFSGIGLRWGSGPTCSDSGGLRTLDDALKRCRSSGLEGWALVERAQKLVAEHMPAYGFFNSFDRPARAFERRMGYCWQRASALEWILQRLGFQVRKVYAFANRFPERVVDGRRIPAHILGHIWLRVRIDEEIRDVCPDRQDNQPGSVHFKPITRVRGWGKGILLLTYLGTPVANMAWFAVISAGALFRKTDRGPREQQ